VSGTGFAPKIFSGTSAGAACGSGIAFGGCTLPTPAGTVCLRTGGARGAVRLVRTAAA